MVLAKEPPSALGYFPENDRILKVGIQAKPHISIIQNYALISLASDEEIESFYSSVQETLDSIPNLKEHKIIMGDLNARLGKSNTCSYLIGKYGLGEKNERGEDIEFCNINKLAITNTTKKPVYLDIIKQEKSQSNRLHYEWNNGKVPSKTREQDLELIPTAFSIRFKKMKRPKPPVKLDYKTLDKKYKIAVPSHFEVLLKCDIEKIPNQLWNESKEILHSTAKDIVSKQKYKNNVMEIE